MFFLHALLRVVIGRGELFVELEVVPEWVHRWPRPSAGRNCIVISVDGKWHVDLTPLCGLAGRQGRGSYASKAFGALQAGLPLRGPYTLMEVWQVLSSAPALKSIFGQFVWRVGSALQEYLLRSVWGDEVGPGVTSKRVEISDIFQTAHRLNASLVRYVQACKDKAGCPQYLSLCSDKASVAGFSLRCSLVCLSDGTAIVPPPQVVVGFVLVCLDAGTAQLSRRPGPIPNFCEFRPPCRSHAGQVFSRIWRGHHHIT